VRTARVREWLFRPSVVAMLPVSLCYADGWNHILYSASLVLLRPAPLPARRRNTPPPEPKGRFAFDRG
jgi:hypothetical protein